MDNNLLTITVNGNMFASEGVHVARYLTCYESTEAKHMFNDNYDTIRNTTNFTIKGDLILNRHRTLLPYAAYIVTGGIAYNPQKSNLIACHTQILANECYRQSILDITDLLSVKTDTKQATELLYKQLYINVFSVLELFLSDFILCKIFGGNKQYFQNAVNTLAKKWKKSFEEPTNDQRYAILDILNTRVIFHNFDKIAQLYQDILNIPFPSENNNLSEYVIIRNDLVHRNGLSSIDRMTNRVITRSMLNDIITLTNHLVQSIIDTYTLEYI